MSVVEEPHVNGETVAEEAEQEMRSLLQKHLEWTLRPCLVQEGRVEWERACLNVAVAILKDIPRLLIGSSNTASKGRIHIVILDEVPIDEPFLFEYNPHSLSNDGVPYSQLTLKIRRNSLTHAEHLRTRQLLQWLVFVSSHTALELALLSDSGLPSILVSNKKSRHRHPGKKLTDAIHSSFRQSTASLWSWIQPELDRMGASRSTESLHRLSSGLPLLDMDGEHNDTETDSTSWDHISLEDAIQDLSRMAVSASPTVLFPPPFLLTKLRDRSTETDIEAFDSVKTPADLSLLDRVSWLFSLFTSHSQKQQRASSISLDSRAGLRYIMSDQNRILTMIKHQRILFSYASHILENTFLLPCVLPQLQAIEYYRFSTQPTHPGQDMTLLEYMKHCLETAHDPCQDLSCQLEAVDHVRTYTHYHFQISVSFKLETNQSPTSSDALFLWTVCRKCHSSTSMTQASNETRSYSFGKYLELLIYHPAFAPPSLCEHVDVNGSALRRAFCYKELIVYFDKDPIQLFEIQVSKVCLVNRPNLSEFNETPCSATHLSSSVSALSREVSQFYGTLKFYIAQIESSSQSPGSGDEKTLMMLQDMRMVFSEEHTHLLGTVKIQSLNELNAKRILFCACINRDKEMFESWQQEYAPWFKYEPYWEFPDYYKEPGSKLAPVGTLFPQNGIVLRSAEPMSIIAYTLLWVFIKVI